MTNEEYMSLALDLAREAAEHGEVRQYIPAQMRSQIDRELAPWIENMTPAEKKINR